MLFRSDKFVLRRDGGLWRPPLWTEGVLVRVRDPNLVRAALTGNAGTSESAGAILDEDGRPRFLGVGADLLAASTPTHLPPLAQITLGGGTRAAALDTDGRVYDWGQGSVGRGAMPEPLQAPGFRKVLIGHDWLSAIDSHGTALGFGPGMRDWQRIDPLAELLLRAKAAAGEGDGD